MELFISPVIQTHMDPYPFSLFIDNCSCYRCLRFKENILPDIFLPENQGIRYLNIFILKALTGDKKSPLISLF